MTRVNRPDTLLTELREVQRRLRLLEGTGARAATTATLAVVGAVPGALQSARPADWPATESPGWEGLARTLIPPGEIRLVVEAVADAGTAGQARVVVDGSPAGTELAVSTERTRHVVTLHAEDELTEVEVQARRGAGEGAVRVAALVLPG